MRVGTPDFDELVGGKPVKYSLDVDEVGQMLGPIHPRNLAVVEPKDLRSAVAEIVQDIEGPTTVSEVRR